MNILITSAGRRVSLIRAFQTELKKYNAKGGVFVADAQPELSAAAQAADAFVQVPKLDHPDYISILKEYCINNAVQMVIPTIDTELLLLARHREELGAAGIQAVVCHEAFTRICRDKGDTHKFFESRGIRVAREYDRDSPEYPMFLKPHDGSRSVNTYLVRKPEDLRDYHLANEKLMFLEYLDHSVYDEYTCDLYYGRDHTLKCVVPRKRLEVRDGEVNKGLTTHNKLVGYIREKLGSIEGAVGCLTSQFFMDKNQKDIVGIEINPRFGGGFPLTYRAGANFPGWLLREYLLGESIGPQFDCWEDNLLMLRYDHEIWVRGYSGQ